METKFSLLASNIHPGYLLPRKKPRLHKADEDLTHLCPKCESQSDFLLPTSNYNDVIRLEVPVIGLSSHHLLAVPTSRQFKVDCKGPGA